MKYLLSMNPEVFSFFENEFLAMGLSNMLALYLQIAIHVCILAVITVLVHIMTRKIILRAVIKLARSTKSHYDDYFVHRGLFKRLAMFAPALVIYIAIGLIFRDFPVLLEVLKKLTAIYFVAIAIWAFNAFASAIQDIYNQHEYSKERPIKGYVQGVQLIVILIAVLIIISIIFNVKLTAIFAGLGAIAAVLILVFKDTILGFVASIQLSANKMVKIGDWITMPSHNIDGNIIEMTLNTVKIQNWDKTISTVPTYTLVSESFMNWRGMEESGGRRIKRSINIDMKSVRFCNSTMIEKFKRVKLLKEYIEQEAKEDDNANELNREAWAFDEKRLTNLGVFRKYLELYLHHNPKIHDDMTFLVRHLQPTEKGLPIEIYMFSKVQEWANYEAIQADIFDHILAIIPEFGLQVFQFPTDNITSVIES